MIQTLLVASLLLPSQADTDPAERLVRAEVLEVARGDLEKAMAEYRAIEADDKAPASVRARALLALGRCQRKRGELEAARKTFADVLARHSDEQETARRAKGFLEEIDRGRVDNPEFDWLGDLEKSPEIQARVFELAMQVAGFDRDDVAARQLVALGKAALPVLDKLIEVSADPQHRRKLAAIELQAGRWDRLPLALQDEVPISSILHRFIVSIPRLPEESRRALIAELDKASETSSRDLGHIVRLWAGDVSRARESVPALRRNPPSRELAVRIAEGGPPGIEALGALVLDPMTKKELAELYFNLILERKPEAVSDDLWFAHAKRGFRRFEDIDREGRFELLERLARDSPKGGVSTYFVHSRDPRQEAAGRDIKDPRATDARWARVLRVSRDAGALRFFAVMRDDAIPEYVGFLEQREYQDPDAPLLHMKKHEEGYGVADWAPTRTYARSMLPLLDHEDPDVITIVLDDLSRADVKHIEDALARIERIAREATDPSLRRRAIAALMTLFDRDLEKGKASASILVGEAERAADGVSEQPTATRTRGTLGISEKKQVMKHVTDQVLQRIPEEATPYRHILRAANERGAVMFHEVYYAERQPFALLEEHLDEITHPDLMASVFEIVRRTRPERRQDKQVAAFLERLTRERRAPPHVRAEAWKVAGEPFDWFDWQALLASDDPLAIRLLATTEGWSHRIWERLRSLSEEERTNAFQTALGSPLDEVRMAAVRQFPLDNRKAADVLRRGLEDRASPVRKAAIEQLGAFTRADAAQAFTALLRNEDKAVRVAVLDALTRFADPASIGPMVDLFEDPDTEVRSKALEGVKEIERVLEEKRQWREKLRRTPPKKDAPTEAPSKG